MTETFGDVVREIRHAYGLRQWDLAEAVGVARSAVTRWERNRRHPSAHIVAVMVDLYGEYRARLYVASRRLPPALDDLTADRLRRVLEGYNSWK